jgi:hypothetical protein
MEGYYWRFQSTASIALFRRTTAPRASRFGAVERFRGAVRGNASSAYRP